MGLQLADKSIYTRFVFRAKIAKTSTFRREHNFFSRSQNFLKIELELVNYLSNNMYSLEFWFTLYSRVDICVK